MLLLRSCYVTSMLAASCSPFLGVLLAIAVAYQAAAVDPISRSEAQLQANLSSNADSFPHQGFGGFFGEAEDNAPVADLDIVSSEDRDAGSRPAITGLSDSRPEGKPDYFRRFGCECDHETLSCECYGESVTQVPKNFTSNVKRM